MEILVTNDDGINSPAINKLAEVLKQYGEVKHLKLEDIFGY